MKKHLLTAICVASFAPLAPAAYHLVEDFSSDPFSGGHWSFGAGDNSNSQFSWNASAPAYTGDAGGSLSVDVDSGLPSVRYERSLGITLTQDTDFTLTTTFRFSVVQANENEFMQMSFGLVNSNLTGADRTGTPGNFNSDNVFHTVEFNYFPNLSTFDPSNPGPVMAPAVFGAQKAGGDAFSNFATLLGSDSDLGGNSSGIEELPQDQTLQVTLDYSALNRILSLTLHLVNPDGSLSLLETGVPVLELDTAGSYDSAFGFEVDSLAIMSYQDGWTNPASPSLIADLTFEQMELFSPIPEPGSLLLLVGGLGLLASCRRRSRG